MSKDTLAALGPSHGSREEHRRPPCLHGSHAMSVGPDKTHERPGCHSDFYQFAASDGLILLPTEPFPAARIIEFALKYLSSSSVLGNLILALQVQLLRTRLRPLQFVRDRLVVTAQAAAVTSAVNLQQRQRSVTGAETTHGLSRHRKVMPAGELDVGGNVKTHLGWRTSLPQGGNAEKCGPVVATTRTTCTLTWWAKAPQPDSRLPVRRTVKEVRIEEISENPPLLYDTPTISATTRQIWNALSSTTGACITRCACPVSIEGGVIRIYPAQILINVDPSRTETLFTCSYLASILKDSGVIDTATSDMDKVQDMQDMAIGTRNICW
ncbi:hypothetical protein B0H21DRAFT_712443 [Amylocystis lapponica]|nr:hypothetical protein B0H21DRAFT_712443 [Amylocystis lapponica]